MAAIAAIQPPIPQFAAWQPGHPAVLPRLRPMSTAPEHNRFQRWYFAWAERHYQGLEPALRNRARAMDRYLYSRRGLGVWLGLGGALTGGTAGMHAAGMPLPMALLLSLLVLLGLVIALVGAWLMPEKLAAKGSAGRWVPRIMGAALFVDANEGHWEFGIGRVDGRRELAEQVEVTL